jgi:nucleoside triphosphate pyrophosphatase
MTVLSNASVILASASKTRAALLRAAGLKIEIVPASIDEASVREGMQAEGALPGDIAATLAELKALRVSRHHPGRLVIGADQILACKGRLFEKPGGREAAAAQLRALSGSIHELASGVCVARDGDVIWHRIETAELAMRHLSEAFIAAYLDAAGEGIYGHVGAYALEGVGIQLFSAIIGDYFSILGLPLLPLLDFLREHNIVPG